MINRKHSILRIFTFAACLMAVLLLGTTALLAQAPAKMTFATKNGNVNFDHAAHVKRANGDCSSCHDKLFPKDGKAALNYKPAMHKTAEAQGTSCGACHHAGGAAFESKANCAKCHTKA
jgi:c(7)-type cytochrome triheme protein